MEPLVGSVIQSGLSAVFALILGLVSAIGLLAVSARYRRMAEGLAIVPSVLPPLFILVSSLSLIQPFPYGLAGIIILHAAMNSGFVAVLLARSIESRFASNSFLVLVEGATRHQFLSVILSGIRSDLARIGFMVFVFCMSSFSIPFVAGAGNWPTLEVSIYHLVRVEANSRAAMLLAVSQFLLVFGLSWLLPKSFRSNWQPHVLHVIPSRWALPLLFGPTVLCFAGLAIDFSKVFLILAELPLRAVVGSVFIGLATGLGTFLCCVLLLPMCSHWLLHRFFLGLSMPSLSVLGWLFIFTGSWLPGELVFVVMMIAVGFPSLYRSHLAEKVSSIEETHHQLKILGASYWQGWLWVMVPQIAPAAGFAAGLSAVWAMGDFALSRYIFHRPYHLAILADAMTERYRLHDAIVVLWCLFFLSLVVFLLFAGLGYAFRRKLTFPV